MRRSNEFEDFANRLLGRSESQRQRTGQVPLFVVLLYAFWLGGCFHLAFAPYGFFPALLFSVGGLVWILKSDKNLNARRVLLYLFGYGIGKYGIGLFWIHESIHGFGGASLWAAVAAVALLAVVLGGINAAFFVPTMEPTSKHPTPPNSDAANVKQESFGRALMGCLSFAVAWSVAETSLAFFGFNWLSAGVALLDTPLEGYIPLGEKWAGFVGVFVAAVLGAALRAPRLLVVLAPVLVGAIALPEIEWTSEVGTRLVAVVQADIPLERKWRYEQRESVLSDYLEMSRPVAKDRVVVWPETAVPMEVQELKEALGPFVASTNTTLVVGSFLRDIVATRDRSVGKERWYNVAIVLGEGTGTYKKQRLVPFGEYVPLGNLLRDWMKWVNIPMNDYTEGSSRQKALELGSDHAGVAICYDIAYPFSRRMSRNSTFFLTLSEDGWFGDSNLPHQHLQIARVRALESRKAIVRSTNRGISAIILPDGSIHSSLPLFSRGVLTAEIPLMKGSSPGSDEFFSSGVFPILCGFLLIVIGSQNFRKSRQEKKRLSEPE